MLRISVPNRPKLLLCSPKNAPLLGITLENTNTRKNDLLLFFEECIKNEEEEDENAELDKVNIDFTSEKDVALAEQCLKLGLKGGVSLP